jgi:hypothetical protein
MKMTSHRAIRFTVCQIKIENDFIFELLAVLGIPNIYIKHWYLTLNHIYCAGEIVLKSYFPREFFLSKDK